MSGEGPASESERTEALVSYASVRVENTTGNPSDTIIVDVETGRKIHSVTEVDIHVEAQEEPRIRLTLENPLWLFIGKPEVVCRLQELANELRGVAQLGSMAFPHQVEAWANRIEQEIAVASGLRVQTVTPPP